MGERNPNAEVIIFHQIARRHALLLFPRHDGRAYYYRHGRLLAQTSHWRDQGKARFDSEVRLYEQFTALQSRPPVRVALLLWSRAPRDRRGGLRRIVARAVVSSSTTWRKGESDRRGSPGRSTCSCSPRASGSTPHTIGALAPYTRYVIASPDNLHLSYFDLEPRETALVPDRMTKVLPTSRIGFARNAFTKLAADLQTTVSVVVYDAKDVADFVEAALRRLRPHLEGRGRHVARSRGALRLRRRLHGRAARDEQGTHGALPRAQLRTHEGTKQAHSGWGAGASWNRARVSSKVLSAQGHPDSGTSNHPRGSQLGLAPFQTLRSISTLSRPGRSSPTAGRQPIHQRIARSREQAAYARVLTHRQGVVMLQTDSSRRRGYFVACSLIASLVAMAGCGSDSDNPAGPARRHRSRPAVSSTNPAEWRHTSVAVITASFSEAMDASTITTATFAVSRTWRGVRDRRNRRLQCVDLHCEASRRHSALRTEHGVYGDDHDRGQGCRRQRAREQPCVELHDRRRRQAARSSPTLAGPAPFAVLAGSTVTNTGVNQSDAETWA